MDNLQSSTLNDKIPINTGQSSIPTDFLVKNKSNDLIFKTPKSKIEKPCCSYKLSNDDCNEQSSILKTLNNKRTISFSTEILNQHSESHLTKPQRFLYKSSSSRTLSNKLLKRSIQCTKSSTSNVCNTGGSTVLSSNTKSNLSMCIIALVEGRGGASGEIGLACIDLKNPELDISQFSDSISYSRTLLKLFIKDPIEIVFPHTMCENGVRSKLFQIVSEFINSSSITTIHRRYYNDVNGKEFIQNLCHKDYTSVLYESREKYYALAACAAVIKYVEFIQNIVFAPGSLKIVFSGSVQCMMLDIATVRNLELVQNSKDLTDCGSLFYVLNFTKTIGGLRLLRANILQPSFDYTTIISRYDCVEELMNNTELFFSLKSQIGHFISLNHLLSLCVQLPKQRTVKSAENTITQVIALKHAMKLIPTLRTTLQAFKSSLLLQYYSLLVDSRYDKILSMINMVVHEEVCFEKGILQMRSQKLFAIKDGINVLLDVARQSYSEQIEALRDEVKLLSEEYSLPFRAAFNNSRGFFIQITLNNMRSKPVLTLPFIKIAVYKNILSCTTEKIMKLNERLKGALTEIYLTAEIVLAELIKEIRVHMGVLYRLSEITATIDLLLSYAQISKMQNYVRPEFTDTLALKNCRNPLHDRLSQQNTVSNHVYSSSLCNFTIVTGANMSGKSMYLRQIALVQIMAQIGCFIPAEYASLRLTDHLFTRIGVDDDIYSNSSTFTIEMREMSYIINSLTDNSLVLIDELGRGTSFDEGLGICFAICEHLLHSKAFIFIATHFIEITKLESLYPNVQNVFFEVKNISELDNDGIRLLFTYRCLIGACTYNTKGLRLAKLANLPEKVIDEAEKIYQRLKDQKDVSPEFDNEICETNAINHEIIKNSTKVLELARDIQSDSDQLKVYLSTLQNYCKKILENHGN